MSSNEKSDAPKAHGTLFIHSVPAALCRHLEWAIGDVLSERLNLAWRTQSALPGSFRSELAWTGPQGTAAKIASALRGWEYIRFEVVEEPSAGVDGSRYQGTPSLGIHHSIVGISGDILINEDRLRAAIDRGQRNGGSVTEEIGAILGAAWDRELEIFRAAGDDENLRWMPETG
ncbi:MAG TPA: DUF3145 family protein [Candidatus Nanopelagicaceae bacterium]|nr:DUF3145 family protein [Candidatus Nanopelagicaceae bacterium]